MYLAFGLARIQNKDLFLGAIMFYNRYAQQLVKTQQFAKLAEISKKLPPSAPGVETLNRQKCNADEIRPEFLAAADEHFSEIFGSTDDYHFSATVKLCFIS